MELFYAIARIEWRDAEEAGVSYNAVYFEGEDRNDRRIRIYLERDITPGEIVVAPIFVEDVGSPIKPLNALYREGATFTIGSREYRPNQAHGEILAVRRASPTPSDAAFHDILRACRQPTTAVLKAALSARPDLAPWQADHINYLAGFTHFAEAEPPLTEFGMRFEKSPSGLTALYDYERRTRHIKVLLNDLTHQVTGLSPVIIAEDHQSPLFQNKVANRDPHSGNYVTDFSSNGRDRETYFRWVNSLEIGIGELVTSFSVLPDSVSGTEASDMRTVVHAAHIPARNTVESLPRLFSNMGIVGTAYWAESRFNLSFERLLENTEILPSLAGALWVLLETEDIRDAIKAVNEIGAQYVVVPPPDLHKGLMGPTGRIDQDYMGRIVTLIRERL